MHGHQFSNQNKQLSCIFKMVFQASPFPSPRVMFPRVLLGLYPASNQMLCHPPSLQEPSLPSPGQLLTKPLTRLDGENPQHALDINKVVSDTSGRGQDGSVQGLDLGSWVLAGTWGPQMSCHCPALCLQMLRLLGDGSLQPWQEQTMGTYLVRQGHRRPALRDELFSQLVAQLWHNMDEQQNQRGWALMAILLSAFPPMPTLQKPLLK